MVGRWGMSEKIGLVSVLPGPGEEGNPFAGDSLASPATRELIDAEVRRIVEECYDRAVAMLRENDEKLEALAKALLDKETLDEAEAYAVAGFDRPPRSQEERSSAEKPVNVARDAPDGKADGGR
jgi:cell division protease FtsH